jgi:hypothetical protein
MMEVGSFLGKQRILPGIEGKNKSSKRRRFS